MLADPSRREPMIWGRVSSPRRAWSTTAEALYGPVAAPPQPGDAVAPELLDPRSVDVYDYLQMDWFQLAQGGRRGWPTARTSTTAGRTCTHDHRDRSRWWPTAPSSVAGPTWWSGRSNTAARGAARHQRRRGGGQHRAPGDRREHAALDRRLATAGRRSARTTRTSSRTWPSCRWVRGGWWPSPADGAAPARSHRIGANPLTERIYF